MKTPEDVINRFINEENVKFNQERDDWVIEAMEEYAKLYHESKVKKLNIPVVSERFFLCDCNSEALLLTRFVDDFNKEIYLSIYTIGQFQKKPNIWKRLKYCWYHLKTGKKYEDQMILNFEKAQQVSEWLSLNAR